MSSDTQTRCCLPAAQLEVNSWCARHNGPMASSPYQLVLGDRFGALDASLQRYFGAIPAGSVGVGHGVYEQAGSRKRVLRPLLAWLAWRRILFPEFGRDVPFTVVNTPGGHGELSATRTFDFPGRRRRMQDSMSVRDGVLIDRLGRRGGLEVGLHLEVVDGGLRMHSGRFRLRLGALRVPLPRVARLTLDERTDPVDASRQRVDVRITAPLLGEVFKYAGSFTYAYVPLDSAQLPHVSGVGGTIDA